MFDRRPFLDVAVRRANPAIPHALQAVTAKCLAFSPTDRYADAQQLERDLHRFLRHQPLPFASNPSSRERAINWVVRNRRAFTYAVGAFLLTSLLSGLWHFRPARPPNPPRIETSSVFQAAVRDFDEGNLELAESRFEQLAQENPNSCLVKFYLGLVLKDNDEKRSEADNALRVALAASDAPATLGHWAESHHEVIDSLVEFGYSRLVRIDEDAEKFDYKESKVSDGDRDRVIRRPTYELVRPALTLAENLDPTRHKTQFLLAKTERLFGEYLQGYQRLSTLINALNRDEKPDQGLLFSCYELRGWITFLWAEQERQEKKNSPTEQSRKRMGEAVKDLERCYVFLSGSGTVLGGAMDGNKLDTMNRKIYHSMHNRMRAMLTLGEIEADLSPKFDARTSLRLAKRMLKPLNEYIESHDLKGRVPDTTDLETRLRDLEGRLTVLSKNER